MGKPMGRNMLNAGHSVTGYDLVPEAVDYLVEQFGGKSRRLREGGDGRAPTSS